MLHLACSRLAARRGRTPVRVVLVASLIFALLPLAPAAAAPAAWPAAWTPYTFSDGTAIRDVGGDNSPGHSDIWSAAATGEGPLPTTYYASDGTNIFFRLRAADDPETNKGGSFQSGVWLVQIAVDGVHRASIGLNGKPAGVKDEVYVSDPDGAVYNAVYNPVVPDGGGSEGGRIVPDGTGGYFIDFQLPIAAITAVAPEVTPDAPVQLFFGTSQNTNNINKDWMRGSDVSFVGLAVVALDGSPPAAADSSTEVAVTSPPTTTDPTPTITGTGEPGATISVEIDGQSLTGTVAADGSWSLTVPTALADGPYTVDVTATDAAGNTATTTQTLSVDSATAVAIGALGATDNPTPVITGTGEPGATISLDVDGQSLTGTVDGTGSWSISVPAPLADGPYTVDVTATDLAGNTATDSEALVVDTQTFTAVTSPTLTTDPTPTITGTGEPGAGVSVDVGGQILTATVDGAGDWSVAVPVALTDGPHIVTATATDALGNVAATTQNLTVDTTTIVGVTSATTTSDPTPAIVGTGEPGSTAVVTVGGQTLTTAVATDGTWSASVPMALADGDHPVSVTATDLAGNTATTTQTLTIDSTTFVTITSPELTADSTPTITGLAEPFAEIMVEIGTETLATTADADGNWTVTATDPLDDGSHLVPVTATVTDGTGNSAETSHLLTVDTSTEVAVTSAAATTDPTPAIGGTGEPGAAVNVQLAGQTLTTTVDGEGSWSVTVPLPLDDDTHPVSVTATDLVGNTATATRDLLVDTQTFVAVESAPLTNESTPTLSGTGEPDATIEVAVDEQTLTTTVAAGGTWSVTAGALDEGAHAVTFTATDILGNTASTTQILTVDTTTTVAVTSPATTDTPTPGISGTGEPGSTVDVAVDGQDLGATVDGTSTWWVAVPTALADGTHVVSVTATDLAGNTATTTQDLTVATGRAVDESPPPGEEPDPDMAIPAPTIGTEPNPTISGTAEPGSTVSVGVAGETLTTTVAGDRTWSVQLPETLEPGVYEARITITDPAGNTGEIVITVEVKGAVQESAAADGFGEPPAVLAFTGVSSHHLVAGALTLVSLGMMLTIAGRRREQLVEQS